MRTKPVIKDKNEIERLLLFPTSVFSTILDDNETDRLKLIDEVYEPEYKLTTSELDPDKELDRLRGRKSSAD